MHWARQLFVLLGWMIFTVHCDILDNDTTLITTTISSIETTNQVRVTTTNSSTVTTTNPTTFTINQQVQNSEVVTVKPIRTFKDEEKEILDFMNSLMRQILPHVVKGSSTNLSPKCTGAMMKIFGSIRQLKAWTFKFLDSMGKPTSGILQGTPYSMAHYDQCLNLSITNKGLETLNREEELFHGKYCRIKIQMADAILIKAHLYKQGKVNRSELGKLRDMIDAAPFIPFVKNPMSHYVGLCFPSLCHTEDIHKLLESLPVPASATLENCETKEDITVDFEKRVILGILFLIIFVIIIGTAVDKLIHFLADENLNLYLKKRCISIAISFSIFSNTEKMFQKVENDVKEFPNWRVLRGLVVGTIFCLIVYHTYLPPFEAFYLQSSNLAKLESYLDQRYFSATVCLPIVVETLFLNYGFSLTNKVWKSTWTKGKKKINVLQIIISSYVRLCLPLLLCNGIIVLLPLVGFGPFWNDVFGLSNENCQKFWWHHLAMISNFYDEKEQCLPHFWFVPCLMQLIIISTLMMFIISRCRKFGLLMTFGLILGCTVAVGIFTVNGDYPPTYIAYFFARGSDDFWRINYALPLNHAGSFSIGMLLGVYMAKGKRLTLKSITCLLGWILSLGYIVGCMLLMFAYRDGTMTPAWSATYAATHRTLFAAAVGWIFLACAYDYGGSLTKMLSWSALDPLYKMSFFAYLIHLILIGYHIGTYREHFNYSHSEMLMRSLGYICLTYVASYVCCLVIDMPLKSLRGALFSFSFRQVNITSLNNGLKRSAINQPGKQNDTSYFNVWNLESAKNGSNKY